MTVKRVNFTGRRRVPRERIDLTLFDGQPRRFDATIDLDGLDFLAEAAVYLEATCAGSTVTERFAFGTVGELQHPEPPVLTKLEGENVWFTLKIVDRTERFGRILGIAEHIQPKRTGQKAVDGRRGILPIEPVELGQQLWRLEFREHDVYLLVNRNVPGFADRMRSDPLIYAALYPEIVRQILRAAIAANVDLEDDEDRWPIHWLRFGKLHHPGQQVPPTLDDSEDDRDEWVQEVVEHFCDTHALRDKFLAATDSLGTES